LQEVNELGHADSGIRWEKNGIEVKEGKGGKKRDAPGRQKGCRTIIPGEEEIEVSAWQNRKGGVNGSSNRESY